MPPRARLSLLLGALACLPGRPASAAEPEPTTISDTTWRALDQRDVHLRLRSGLEVRGRLIGDDTDTIALRQASGAVANLRKDDITSVTLAPAPAPAPTPNARIGLRRSGGYLLVSPGAISQQFTLPHRGIPLASVTHYQWGLAAGGYFAAADRFALAGGVTIQQAVGRQSSRLLASLLRVGLELRTGVSGPRHFVYGVLDLNVVVHNIVDREPDTANVQRLGIGGSLGAGAQGLLGQRFLLGGELKTALNGLYSRQFEGVASGGLTIVTLDLRVLLGLKF